MLYSKNIIKSRLVYKVTVVLIIIVTGVLFYGSINGYYGDYSFIRVKPNFNLNYNFELQFKDHLQSIHNFFNKRQNWETSNLGSILFKLRDRQVFIHSSRQNRTYVILIWKYFEWLNNRHVFNFSKNQSSNTEERLSDMLEDCPVQNCEFTGDDSLMPKVDAVVIHMQKGVFPKVKDRNINQRWIFLSDESPKHTFTLAKRKPSFKELANVFNWTMTYRSDSDIPVPYGRTLPLNIPHFTDVDDEIKSIEALIPYWDIKKQDVFITILISNCDIKERTKFLKELQQHIPVHIFGKCSDNKEFQFACPGHFKNDCEIIQQYKFYLVLENTHCRQYMTEKVFNNAYSKGAIPIIMGPPLSDCEKLLPPESFIHVSKFKTPFDLAQYVRMLSGNYIALMSYHRWRNNFYIVNEHGYFKSKSIHYCRVCEALNYNDGERSVYSEDDLRLFFDPSISCT